MSTLNKVRFFLCLIPAVILSAGCSIITFEELVISCSVDQEGMYFADGNNVYILFSIEPDKTDIEDKLTLKEGSKTKEVQTVWEDNKLFIQPENDWVPGEKYQIILSSPLIMADGRSYSNSFKRNFYFGQENNELKVTDFSPQNGEEIEQTSSIQLSFNKAIDTVSFLESFSVSPSCDTRCLFSEDKKTVTITPQDGWEYNTVYEWSFSDVLAADGYSLDIPFENNFRTEIHTDSPVLETVCPVLNDNQHITWLETASLDSLTEDQPFGFIFSNEMDFNSIESGITFTPALNGYFLRDNTYTNRYVFFPQETYDIDQIYKISIATSVQDCNGLALYTDLSFSFTSSNTYLNVSGIQFDSTAVSLQQAPNECVEYTVPASNQIQTNIMFSTVIDEAVRNDVVDTIQFSLIFPLSGSNPIIRSVQWDVDYRTLSIVWENFSVSSADVSYYYELLIPGGSSGIENGRGEYMESDVCIKVKSIQ